MTDENKTVLSTGVWELGLSWRPYQLLLDAGMRKVRDVVECSAEELSQIKNLGPKSLAEIKSKIEAAGFALRDPTTPKVEIPLFHPDFFKRKFANQWFYPPDCYPGPGQMVLFYCVNGAAFLGIYVKGFGWCVAQPKNQSHDWGTIIKITVGVVRWMSMPDPDYDREFA